MFKHILLATDGSAHADRAADIAAGLAATCGAKLTLMHVAPDSLTVDDLARSPRADRLSQRVRDDIGKMREIFQDVSLSDDMMATPIPAPQSAIRGLAEDILGEAEQHAKTRNVKNVVRAIAAGDPAHEILEHARETGTDLIVMGTRGLSDIGGLFLGSVSHKIMHLADCPCLTVK